MRHLDALLLSQHKAITLSPHMVKNGGVKIEPPPEWVGPFCWQVGATHPCSGAAPILSSYRWSHTDYDTGWPEYNPTTWTALISGVIDWVFWMGIGNNQAVNFDYREPDERYLVETYSARIESSGNFGGHIIRRIIKRHKNTNAVISIDLETSDNDGTDWTSLYHWDVDDDGLKTETGTDLDGYFGIIPWYEDIVGDSPGDGYIPADCIPGQLTRNRTATTTALQSGAVFDWLYVDVSNNILLTVNWQISYVMSNDDPWSVELAQDECDAMSATIDIDVEAPEYGSPPTEFDPPPFSGRVLVELTYSGPADTVPLELVCTLIDEPVPRSVPSVDGDIMPLASNWFYSGANGIYQLKTKLGLPSGLYTKRTETETLPVAATNLPGSPDPTPATTDNGAADSVGATSEVQISPNGLGEVYYYPVPTAWSKIELEYG